MSLLGGVTLRGRHAAAYSWLPSQLPQERFALALHVVDGLTIN